MKLTFKKQPKETGLHTVGNPYQFVDIKGDKKKVGWIQPRNWQAEFFTIWFHVKHEDNFKNICLKFKCRTEQEARQFIKDNWVSIQEGYALHQLED